MSEPVMQRDRSERNILAGFFLIALCWGVDFILEAFVFRAAEGGFAAGGLDESSLHALFLTLQLGLLVYTWRVFEQRDRIRDTLKVALGRIESEKSRFEAVIAAMGDGVSIQDRNYRVVYQNKVHQELIGGDRQGGLCYREYAKRDAVCPDCPVEQCFLDGQVHRQEKRAAPGVTASHVEITASPLRDAVGTVVAGIELVRDISAQKSAEEGLARQTAFLQMLIDAIPLPVFYMDATGRYLGCNREFELRLGVPSTELVGKMVFDIAPAEAARLYFSHDIDLLEQGGTQVFEESVRFADGEMHDVILHKAVFCADGLLPDGLIGVMVDVTELHRYQARVEELNDDLTRKAVELEAANRDLESFSYSASHDLKNPLTQMSASAQLLAELGQSAPEERHRFLVDTILDSCDRMEHLIDDLLTLSRISGSTEGFTSVDLSSLAASVALDIRVTGPERQVLLTIEPDLYAVCVSGLMRIVLENLLGNAWKYTATTPGAQIAFGRVEIDGQQAFYVRDNGVGFDMGQVSRLFKPFQRLHGDDFPGNGIGLATVQRIIDRHGGRVRAEGAVGEGATFYFTLPSR